MFIRISKNDKNMLTFVLRGVIVCVSRNDKYVLKIIFKRRGRLKMSSEAFRTENIEKNIEENVDTKVKKNIFDLVTAFIIICEGIMRIYKMRAMKYFSLDEFDPSSISYYKSHEVSFSNGDAIDLSDVSNEKLAKKIAARIYKTRNSLVHSKSNDSRVKERGIYHPFADEKELAKEIPLMRIIAESIIINSAKPI